MAAVNCNADVLANELFTSLTAGVVLPADVDFSGTDFTYSPDTSSALYQTPADLTIDDLTTVALDGTGIFDKLMSSVDLHIQREFKANRITADKYAEVYVGLVSTVLGNATQFTLSKDQTRWNTIQAQLQARKSDIDLVQARIGLESAKYDAKRMLFDMQNAGAQYALTKINVANADAQHCLLKAQTAQEQFRGEFLLPAELAIQQYQRMQVLPSSVNINKVQSDRVLPAQAAIAEFTNRTLQPIEKDVRLFELERTLPSQTGLTDFQLERMLPVQLAVEQYRLNTDMPIGTAILKEQEESARAQTLNTRSDGITPVSGLLGAQRSLMGEQLEVERAKTLDTRTSGIAVVGSVGKQKDLYTQQIDSFIKDAQYKASKLYLDSWITQKTLDDALLPPTELQNTTINSVLSNLRNTHNL